MKLFECETCPKRLKCELTNKRIETIKKWAGNELFKSVWTILDKDDADINKGLKIGGIVARAYSNINNYEMFNKIVNDIKDCVYYKLKSDRINQIKKLRNKVKIELKKEDKE